MLTILAPKLNHPYVLQDQMVPVGVCLQALCMRSVAAFQTKAEYFNSPRRRWGINGKRLDFIGSWAARLHSTTILCTFTWCIWGPRNSDMCLTCSVFLVGLWRTLGRKTSTWAPGSGGCRWTRREQSIRPSLSLHQPGAPERNVFPVSTSFLPWAVMTSHAHPQLLLLDADENREKKLSRGLPSSLFLVHGPQSH